MNFGFPIGMLAPAAAAAADSTWNPSDRSASITLTGGNLVATGGAFAAASVRGTLSKSSGKHYFECLVNAHNVAGGGGTPRLRVGIATGAHSLATLFGEYDSLSAVY